MDLQLPPNLATEAPQQLEGKRADVQVSSADILLEAHQLKQAPYKAAKQSIQDLEELRLFQQTKRKEYEQHLNKNRLNYGQWIRYAKWELEHNHDFRRARSIMERALEVNVQHVPFWVRYIEMESMHRNVNHARNLLDRAVTTLPYTDKLWYMYVQTEEALGNYTSVRSIFERWVSWKPAKTVWQAYIGFEQRYDEYDNVRALFPRFLAEYPEGEIWLAWADFERVGVPLNDQLVSRIRGVFESALDSMAENGSLQTDDSVPELVLRWCTWEALQGELERARTIFQTVLDVALEEQKNRLSAIIVEFESRHGGTDLIDSAVSTKEKAQLELTIYKNPRDYNAWRDYLKLEEESSTESLRSLFRRSVSVPPEEQYKLVSWRRYVFLWIKFALWEEFNNRNIENARKCWADAIATIPHKKFTFAKIWVMAALFELRYNNEAGLVAARKLLGKAIGLTCTTTLKSKLFRFYIDLETKLNEWSRVRSLYTKWIEVALLFDLENEESHRALDVLKDFINKELEFGESDRCIALFEMALDTQNKATSAVNAHLSFKPREELFNTFINFLKDELMYERARDVFRRELTDTPKAELWIEFANFELSILSPSQVESLENAEDDVEFKLEDHQKGKTREVFTEAVKHFKDNDDAKSCITVLEAWKSYEEAHGDAESVEKVAKRFPTPVTKRRATEQGEEVFTEYIFPQEAPNINKFLANAKKWASQSASQEA